MENKLPEKYENIEIEISRLKRDLEILKELSENYKEAAEFWKEKYDNYHKEMDDFLDRTNAKLNTILKEQEDNRKSIESILEKMKETNGVVYNWIRKN